MRNPPALAMYLAYTDQATELPCARVGEKVGSYFNESNLEIQNLVLSLTPVPILEMNIVV